ncbi:type I methionyl aminopeptidase [Candidatus Woesebacteria bacterium]|nr:type I methionyl aminopeptidase [Candidatus Woesebacteria bacterium]
MPDITQFLPQDRPRIEAMLTGGSLLGSVRDQLRDHAVVGTTFEAIEQAAQQLIKAAGAKPSFSTVRDYRWATCIMKNDALCHGIPQNGVVAAGDIITIDVGLIYNGFHNDTTITFAVGKVSPETEEFLKIGQQSLANAIAVVRAGASVFDISRAMEQLPLRKGFGLVQELTGHGVGAHLHEEPNIPCRSDRSDKSTKLRVGQTIAVEIMYTMGDPQLTVDADHWTFRTKDRSLSGMFEDTVLVTKNGAEVLTKPSVTGIL